MLSVKDLFLTKKKPILKGVSLDFPKGRISLLLGKSGSGKTSILRCVSQLEKDYVGEITPAQAGFVPQSFALFPHMTVYENIAQPLRLASPKAALREEVGKVLSSLDIEELALSRPHELSGGQQQRVAIARALILNPDFLIFDEPTSALDPENTARFVQILQKLKEEGKGIIVSSQDMAFASQVLDNVFFLEEGEIVERYDASIGLPLESKLQQFLYGAANKAD
ncbi:MAG: amino acid ABC transporter ATP-binding protein [Verrucomicrobia bacterium]|nr:amino acid ABC transporter ATP-binding protein [Verrucomicrobiota bacterium]